MSVHPAVVDSSGWIEVFTDGPKAGPFLDVLDAESTLVVPAISRSSLSMPVAKSVMVSMAPVDSSLLCAV